MKKIKNLRKIINKPNIKEVAEEGYIKFDFKFNKTKSTEKSKIVDLNNYRQKLYNLKLIGAYPNKVGYGNISMRDNKNIIISGSKTGNYKKLNESHYSIVSKYDFHKNKIFCSGAIKPSSETLTHAAIYECDKKIGAVIHVHNLEMWKKYLNKLPTTLKSIKYGTPEMAFEIQRLYHQTDFKEKQIAVLEGHKEGIISFGKNLSEAYNIILKYFNK